MTSPLSSFSGIVSGFNYKDLVDQIVTIEGRPATRLRSESAAIGDRLKAIGAYRTLLDKLRTAADAFRSGAALDSTSASTIVEAGTRPLATVVSSPGASPASFTLEVSQLARAQKLGSLDQPSRTAQLGIAGSFMVNGGAVTVTATDSLNTVRDKINALNTGATPTKVTASILTVGPGQERLVLTSDAQGLAGAALADTTGTVLQTLGFLDGAGAIVAGAVLADGRDAIFKIDGVDLIRSSNTISDAVAGLTLTLTSEEPGARTGIKLERYADSARAQAQSFVDAYNGLVSFLKAQGTASDTQRPALYGDSLVRTARSALPARVLEKVFGAAPDLATASAAGFSFQRDGTLTLDSAKLADAFTNRYQDLRALFVETRTATDPNVSFVSSGGTAGSGNYAVDITAAATRATVGSAGFGGVYDAGATPDVLTITDNLIGKSVNVNLTTGMTTADIVLAMQTAFDAQGLNLTAAANGTDVSVTHKAYGTLAGITVSNAGTGDGAAELFAAPVTSYGTNVAGTIGGHPATGNGQVLVGDTGSASAGLTVSYAGTVPAAAGTITLGLGTGALVERVLDTYLESATGSLSRREASLNERSTALDARATEIEGRLEHRRASLMQKFVAMEAAIARLQTQAKSIAGLNPNKDSSS